MSTYFHKQIIQNGDSPLSFLVFYRMGQGPISTTLSNINTPGNGGSSGGSSSGGNSNSQNNGNGSENGGNHGGSGPPCQTQPGTNYRPIWPVTPGNPTPDNLCQVRQTVDNTLPIGLIRVVNELIVKNINMQNNRAIVTQESIMNMFRFQTGFLGTTINERSWNRMMDAFRQANWRVRFSTPGANITPGHIDFFEPYFTFTGIPI